MTFPYDHLSPSSINRYLQCPLKFLYEKEGKEKRWDDRYAVTGGYIHHNIECAYTGDLVNAMQLDSEMEKRFNESLLGWRRIIRRHGLEPDKGETVECTKTRTIDGVTVLGRIDYMRTEKDGQLMIVDWKSGSKTDNDILQLRIYQWLAEGWHDPSKINVFGAYLRDGTLERIPYTSSAHIEIVLRKVIDGINKGVFAPTKTKECGRCEYRYDCEGWTC